MTTSAPADCACRESRMASAVLVAPVCAITGTRPATWSTTVSTTRRRSSLLSVLNSPVEPHATTPCTPPVIDRSTRARSDGSSTLPSAAKGVASAVSTPRSCTVICCLLCSSPGRGQLSANGQGALAIGRQQAQDLLRGREPGLDGGLGVQRPEVVAGQEDPACPPHERGLERAPAREAVGGTGLPALDLGFDDGDDGALLVDDLDDLGTELNAVAEGRGDPLRQGGRATQDAPVQALADIPHQA